MKEKKTNVFANAFLPSFLYLSGIAPLEDEDPRSLGFVAFAQLSVWANQIRSADAKGTGARAIFWTL